MSQFPQIIGFSGEAHSGKDTAQKILQEYYEKNGLKTSTISFASGIKDVCAVLFKWDRARLDWDTAYKESNLLDDGTVDPVCAIYNRTRRQMLQDVGTEAFRKGIDYDFWVKHKILEIQRGVFNEFDILFITDNRFLNELGFTRTQGGIIVRIVSKSGSTTSSSNHQSELEWKQWTDWDIFVENPYDPGLPYEVNYANYQESILSHTLLRQPVPKLVPPVDDPQRLIFS